MSDVSAPRQVTVIITCYNQREWISQAIDSALAQGPDAEVLVVDDGSTDGSGAVIDAFGTSIRAIHTANRGVAAARNRGIDEASGTYLLFLDGDDYLGRGFIGAALAALQADGDAGYAYPATAMFGVESSRPTPPPSWDVASLAAENFVFVSSLFRKNAVRTARFDPTLPGLEDWDFVLALLDEGVTGTPAPDATLFYRRHVGNQSRGNRAAASAIAALRLHIRIQLRYPRSVPRSIIATSTVVRGVQIARSKARGALSRMRCLRRLRNKASGAASKFPATGSTEACGGQSAIPNRPES